MNLVKKIVSLVMAALIFTSITGDAIAATVPGAVYSDQQAAGVNKPVSQIQQELVQAGIQDVKPTDWFAGSVTVVVQAGLIAPKQDGTFQPDQTLTTAQGVSVFAKVLGIAAKTDTPEQALQKAKDAGIVSPSISSGTDMSRMDVARLLAVALGVQPSQTISPSDYPFGDYQGLTFEEMSIMKALYDMGIFKGYPSESGKPDFRPSGTLTNAEIAILVDRILGSH